MHDVKLSVGGRDYSGWNRIRIQRGIEQIAGAFEVSYSDRWAPAAQPIALGARCVVTIDKTPVITGYVDDLVVDVDARRRSMTCMGRDAAGDLVDCSAGIMVWRDQTVTRIVTDICAPFGIGVRAIAPAGGPIGWFGIEPGETAFEAIDRACRYRGLLCVSDGVGGVVLTGVGTARVAALKEGVNMVAGSRYRSARDRFSTYTVCGSDVGTDDSLPEQNAEPTGRASDPGIRRYRPMIIIAENPDDTDAMTRRAVWEAAVRRGRGSRVRVTVPGWAHKSGVWAPNTVATVTSGTLGLDGASMVVVAVELSRDERGTLATLELCDPAGLTPAVIEEQDEL